jgi:hypothetical protein
LRIVEGYVFYPSTASAGPMATAPSLQRWCRGWPPRAPERNPRRPLPRPQTLGAAPTSSRPTIPPYTAPPPHGGFPPCPPQEERRRGEEGGGGKGESWRPPVEEPRPPRYWTATSPPACRRGRWTGERRAWPLRRWSSAQSRHAKSPALLAAHRDATNPPLPLKQVSLSSSPDGC